MNNSTTPQSEQGKLTQLQGDLPSLSDKLRDALTKRFDNPEITQRNEAMSDFFQTASRTREEAIGLLGAEGAPARPGAVENLVSQRRSTALLPVMNLSNMIQARQGGITDVIDRATNAFNSLLGAQQGRATQAQQEFENRLALTRLTGGNITLPDGTEFNIPAPSSGTDTGMGTGNNYYGDDTGTIPQPSVSFPQPTEPQPKRIIPRFAGESEGRISPQGQWIFISGEWLPIVD